MLRTVPIFECSPTVTTFASLIGGLTAIFAASVALMQHDLKKIIAYSTCSQLGYMVMACAAMQPFLSLFHLVNHAFFKALLFLGAGIIIHCFGGEQDIRRMGGLRQFFPLTFVSMSIAGAALSGFPFLAGFYSKDFIIGLFAAQGSILGNALWVFSIIAAFFTSTYSFSLVYFIFLGSPRASVSTPQLAHATPFAAALPLVILSIFSVISGFIFKDFFIGVGCDINWTSLGVFSKTETVLELVEFLPFHIKIFTLIAGFFGIFYYVAAELFGISPLTGFYFKA